MSSTTDIRKTIDQLGPRAAFEKLIKENDDLIRGSNLDNGREIASSRCRIFHELMAHWAEEQQDNYGYKHPFAVVAIGGTGRDEMTPCSDTDYAFLFDGSIVGNKFLEGLHEQVVHSSSFRERCGFSGEVLPFSLEDIYDLKEKQLNAFLDMKPVYDPDGLAEAFRSEIRDSYDPFEHFLHVSELWRESWGESASKNEQLDVYDIKKDGLRVFLAGIWTLAGKNFRHSHEIYNEMEDPRDLDAYHFLLRIRSFIHLRKGTRSRPNGLGYHKEDVFGFEDFMALGDMAGHDADERTKFEFANEVRARFLSERRRVGQFTWGVIGRELKRGRIISPGSAIVYGTGGLRDTSTEREGNIQKSRAAIGMLVASQRYGLPIDPVGMETTFRDAGDWLVPVPELAELFYESKGSLADSIKFLAQLPGSLDRLFPGYTRFEVSIDARVAQEKKCLRGALLREKLRALESGLEAGHIALNQAVNPEKLTKPAFEFRNDVEAALLDDDHLAAIRLALFTKRLPETEDDIRARSDESLELHERFSSGFSRINLETYYQESFSACDFPTETLEIAKFLVVNRRLLKEMALKDLMNEEQVRKVVGLCCHDESLIRALYIFTYADRTEWESETTFPDRWFNIRELYVKAVMKVNEVESESYLKEKLSEIGFSSEQLEVLKDFGNDFFNGVYRKHAIRFGDHLLKLKKNKSQPPMVKSIRQGYPNILGIATIDQPGIAASISGAFWKMGVELSQARLFSATNYGLALDFFHLAPPRPEATLQKIGDIITEISSAIVCHSYISDEDEKNLPDVADKITLRKTDSDLYQLRAETKSEIGALMYYLTCKAYRQLDANVYGLAGHTGKDHARVSVYLTLPESISFETAFQEVENWTSSKELQIV